MVSTAGLVAILIYCGFDGGIDGDNYLIRSSVASAARLVVILIDCGFDGGIDGDIDGFGRLWFRRRG